MNRRVRIGACVLAIGLVSVLGLLLVTHFYKPYIAEFSCPRQNLVLTFYDETRAVLYDGKSGKKTLYEYDSELWSTYPAAYANVVLIGNDGTRTLLAIPGGVHAGVMRFDDIRELDGFGCTFKRVR